MPEVLQEHSFSKGLECTADFAFAFPSVENLKPFMQAVPEADWQALKTDDPLSSVHGAQTHGGSRAKNAGSLPGQLSRRAVRPDTTPSIRLLSLVHHGLKLGQAMRWVPWQFRLSARQWQEIMVAKASNALKDAVAQPRLLR